MLHIIAWLAVYAVVLFLLGEVIRPWRTRRGLKALFLPGILIAIAVQALAAKLCVGGRYRAAPLQPGQRAFVIETDVPCLAGALFVLVSHALFYTLFFIAARQLERFAGFDVDAIVLPGLHPHQILEGTIDVDVRSYLTSLRHGFDQLLTNPVPYLAILYLAAPMFASFRLRGREFIWAALLVLVLGYSVSFADHLEMGFPFLSRGWWAGFFVFPEWWGIFSLYVTAALITLALAAAPGVGGLLVRALSPRDEKGGSGDRSASGADRRRAPEAENAR